MAFNFYVIPWIYTMHIGIGNCGDFAQVFLRVASDANARMLRQANDKTKVMSRAQGAVHRFARRSAPPSLTAAVALGALDVDALAGCG